MPDAPALVATLISDPNTFIVSRGLVESAAQALGTIAQIEVLAAGAAVDVLIYEGEGASVETVLREALSGAPVDVVVQPTEHRRKRLLLADMDSTMIGQECIDELADYAGLKAEVAAITERAMAGEIAFEPALRERVALLENLPVGIIDEILAERISLTPGARTLVQTMRANGAYTGLVSGGFTLFTGPIAQKIGFHEHRANRLLVEDGRLAGRVEEPILGREAKVATLTELRRRLGLPREETVAVGDGANDLGMLAEAGLGVAYRAKPAVAAAAHARIDHGDLTALLFVQGYKLEGFETEGRP